MASKHTRGKLKWFRHLWNRDEWGRRYSDQYGAYAPICGNALLSTYYCYQVDALGAQVAGISLQQSEQSDSKGRSLHLLLKKT